MYICLIILLLIYYREGRGGAGYVEQQPEGTTARDQTSTTVSTPRYQQKRYQMYRPKRLYRWAAFYLIQKQTFKKVISF